jgi:hypothetical protein
MAYKLEFHYDSGEMDEDGRRNPLVTLSDRTKVNTVKEAIRWCYEKLESIPGCKEVKEFDEKYQPITVEEAINKLETKGFIYLTPGDGLGAASATKVPGKFYVFLQNLSTWLWMGLILAGIIPVLMFFIVAGYFGLRLGDGQKFFGCALIAGAAIIIALIIASLVALI